MKGIHTRTIQTVIAYVAAVGCFVVSLFEPWGKQSDVPLVMLGIVLLTGAVYLHHKRQSDGKEDNADELITCLNMKRHDWLNHIQVMMGYVSLNKQDRLQTYMRRLMSEAEQESNMSHLGYAPLSRYLLIHDMIDQNIVLDIHIVPVCKVDNDRQGERVLNTIQEVERFLHQTCGPSAGEPLKLGITLAAHEADIMLYIDLPERANLNRGLKQEEWTILCKKVLARNGEVFIEREDPAMECTVRIS